jgi:hypothetical protein
MNTINRKLTNQEKALCFGIVIIFILDIVTNIIFYIPK